MEELPERIAGSREVMADLARFVAGVDADEQDRRLVDEDVVRSRQCPTSYQ